MSQVPCYTAVLKLLRSTTWSLMHIYFIKFPSATSLKDHEAMLPWNITPQQLD